MLALGAEAACQAVPGTTNPKPNPVNVQASILSRLPRKLCMVFWSICGSYVEALGYITWPYCSPKSLLLGLLGSKPLSSSETVYMYSTSGVEWLTLASRSGPSQSAAERGGSWRARGEGTLRTRPDGSKSPNSAANRSVVRSCSGARRTPRLSCGPVPKSLKKLKVFDKEAPNQQVPNL